jgi:hypothetical protein
LGKQHPVETLADYIAPARRAASGWAARSALLPPLFMMTVAISTFAAGDWQCVFRAVNAACRSGSSAGRTGYRRAAELLLEEEDEAVATIR